MPASVVAANPIAVFPASLSASVAHTWEWPAYVNVYRNGESHRALQAESSGKRWRFGKRLTPAQIAILATFWDARRGPSEEFWFRDPWDADPPFGDDPGPPVPDPETGEFPPGWYRVRFEGRFEYTMAIALGDVAVELVQVS